MTSSELPQEYREVRDAWSTAAVATGQALKGHAVVYLPADGGDWIDSGQRISKGQEVTLLPYGQVWLSREANLAFGPNVALWYRAGSAAIARLAGHSVSFKARDEGPLHLIAKPPGEWANRHGDFLSDYPHTGASGGLLVIVLVWSGSVDAGLRAFATSDRTGVARAEIARRASAKPLPAGWQPLWRVGDTSMFSEELDQHGHSVITCRCINDAAILKYPLDVPLNDSVRLNWSWRVTQLPSQQSENTLATHDYLSIAVEFDNGQDLTYLWSSRLPLGTAFRCPIPWWDKHETHIVCRTGNDGLDTWSDESRAILDDYRTSVGFPAPGRIAGIWLIGLSPFQRGVGECRYRSIRLSGEDGTIRIGL